MESEDKGTGTIMLRNFFSFLGVAFIALAIFCAAFIGRLGAELHDQGPAYEKLAVDITRRLSETWSVTDIKEHYAMAVAFALPLEVVFHDAFKAGGPWLRQTFTAGHLLGVPLLQCWDMTRAPESPPGFDHLPAFPVMARWLREIDWPEPPPHAGLTGPAG